MHCHNFVGRKLMYSQSIMTRLAFCCALFLAAALFASVGCSDDDTTANASCNFDSECPLGQVCGANDVCVTAPCSDCIEGQICYRTEANPAGSCSAPECGSDADCVDKGGSCVQGVCTDEECQSNEDCGANEICNLANQCVESDGTCTTDINCPDGQICSNEICREGCNENQDCVDGEYCDMTSRTCQAGCRGDEDCASTQSCTDNRCVCTPGTCGAGRFCNVDSGNCEEAMSCDQITCPEGQVCDPVTFGCVEACTPESCMAGQVCNTATGQCVVDNCVGEDPGQCQDNAQRPLWDPVKCFCAECVSDDDCNTAAGETCNASGVCFACETTCDPSVPGTCGGDTPYCSDGCCIECIGVADCDQTAGELCLDGFCGQPPSCTTDPSVCPSGTTCNTMSGQCEAGMTGASCSQDDPLSCPQGQFCDPTTNTCMGVGGNLGCGLCNPDCTCDNGLTCDGFFCTGCTNTIGIDGIESDCPGEQICLAPLFPICFGG